MKPSFKKAVKLFKKHFWKFFLIDFLFLLVTLAFYVYSRIQIQIFVGALNQYYAQIAELQVLVEQGVPDAMTELTAFIEAVTPLLDRISLFMFFVVPAVIFVLWCFFQSMHYNIIETGKWLNWRKMLVFGGVTLPIYVVVLLIADRMVEGSLMLLAGGISLWLMLLYAVVGILLAYVLQVAYSLYHRAGILELVNRSLIIAFGKFHRVFFIALAYLFVLIFVVASVFEMALKAVVGDYWTTAAVAAVLIGALLILGFMRTFLAVYVKKLA